MHDQEHVVHDVVDLGAGDPEVAGASIDKIELLAVDRREVWARAGSRGCARIRAPLSVEQGHSSAFPARARIRQPYP